MKKRVTLLTTGILCATSLLAGAAVNDAIREIKAQLRPDFTIKIDGDIKHFKNVNGETVQPILYEGTTYLPIRAISEIMGKTVYWYEDDKLIDIKDDSEDITVTDADVIVDGSYEDKQSKPQNTRKPEKTPKPDKSEKQDIDTSGFIGEEKAKEIALEKAGLSESEVKFEKVKLDKDDGNREYEIEFRNGKTEYDAGINAENGTVLKWEVDIDD